MRNCVVLGSGRSGTSMVAGTLAAAGYATARRQWAATDANPHGFHEDRAVNLLNERLLAPATPWVPRGRPGRWWPGRFGDLQRWLAVVEEPPAKPVSPRLKRAMARALPPEPFAVKDPRFCLTLPQWRDVLPDDTVFVVVFRDPARTVESILREVETAPYLRGVHVDRDHAFALWCQSYLAVLDHADAWGEWVFVHYDEVATGTGLDRLGGTLECALDGSFVDPALKRSVGELAVPDRVQEVYERLLAQAGAVDVG